MHSSSSAEQLGAEKFILQALNAEEGTQLRPELVRLPGGCSVQLDGVDHGSLVMCEIYARVGRLKGSQPDKVASDFLKMLLVEKAFGATYKKYFCFASTEARSSVGEKSWLNRTSSEFGIILKTFLLPSDIEQGIVEAQERQRMVNL